MRSAMIPHDKHPPMETYTVRKTTTDFNVTAYAIVRRNGEMMPGRYRSPMGAHNAAKDLGLVRVK